MPCKWILVVPVIMTLVLLEFCQSDECSQSVRENYTISHNGFDNSTCTLNFSCGSLEFLIHQVGIFECVNIEIYDNQILTNQILYFFSPFELSIVGKGHTQPIVIACKNNSGLFFQSARKIRLENLHFVGCSFDVSERIISRDSLSSNFSSVAFSKSQDIEIARCMFGDSIGQALLLVDVNGSNSIEHSTFRGSKSLLGVDDESRSGGVVIRHFSIPGNSNYSIQHCDFKGNINLNANCSKCHGGAINVGVHTQTVAVAIVIQHSNFSFNEAKRGGAIYIEFGQSTMNSICVIDSHFWSNSALVEGGAIEIISKNASVFENQVQSKIRRVYINSTSFINNTGSWGGGVAIYREKDSGLVILEAILSSWDCNSAYFGGFAIGLSNDFIADHGGIVANFHTCQFNENTYTHRDINGVGALHVTGSNITLEGCTLQKNSGTALFMKSQSHAKLVGNVTFIENFGISGSGIHLESASKILIVQNSSILFSRNKAILLGGAIYSRSKLSSTIPCFIDFEDGPGKMIVMFDGNLGNYNDQAIYVGNPKRCNLTVFDEKFTFKPNIDNQILTIPNKIIFSTKPDLVDDTLEIMLGEIFYLHPTVIDMFNHSSVLTHGFLTLLSADDREYSDEYSLVGPSSIGLNNYTKNNEFYITGSETNRTVLLILEFFYTKVTTYHSDDVSLKVVVVPCKIGYRYSSNDQMCTCVEDNNVLCPYDNNSTVCVKKGYWYDRNALKAIPCQSKNCQSIDGRCSDLSKECPRSIGYCQINDSSDLCWEGKGGDMCSQCLANYSFTFKAFKCVPSHTCRFRNTVLIMLGVFAYWILFIVALLFVLTLNLRMGSGFMYGIIFYFSVIPLYTDTTITNTFLRGLVKICITMTQLDPRLFGEVSVCFIESWKYELHHLMFAYVTPLFVIVTILAIIILSRYCKVPRSISLAENSPIHAICMLILFSYNSLSYTNFEILQSIEIDGKLYVRVTPSIPYFSIRDHLPYAMFALCVEVFISLPICFLLLFAPCLSSRINLVKLRLKPVIDEFQACYRPECRWFAGFYFLARQLIFLANSIQQDLPQFNTAMQVLIILTLITHVSFQPYNMKWLNIIDSILLIDIYLVSVYISSVGSGLKYSGLNQLLYASIPYILLLVPACYLFGVIVVLIFKRVQLRLKACCLCEVWRRSSVKQDESVIPTRTSVDIEQDEIADTEHKNRTFNDSFFNDLGEREPLLTGSNSDYEHGSDKSKKSNRVSTLLPFPPRTNKAKTN